MTQRSLVTLLAVIIVAGTIVWGIRYLGSRIPQTPTLTMPSPQPTATPKIVTNAMVIRQMQSVQRLETSRYTIETVVEASTPDGWVSRGERLLLIAHGTVVVGFDLGKLTVADIQVSPDGESVTIALPPAELLASGLDEGKTRIYSRDSGKQLGVLPRSGDPNLETAARRRGLEQIVQSACEDGIAQRAVQDGTAALRNLLILAGFESVYVRVKDPATPLCPGRTAG